jgi:hypothetical protein
VLGTSEAELQYGCWENVSRMGRYCRVIGEGNRADGEELGALQEPPCQNGDMIRSGSPRVKVKGRRSDCLTNLAVGIKFATRVRHRSASLFPQSKG